MATTPPTTIIRPSPRPFMSPAPAVHLTRHLGSRCGPHPPATRQLRTVPARPTERQSATGGRSPGDHAPMAPPPTGDGAITQVVIRESGCPAAGAEPGSCSCPSAARVRTPMPFRPVRRRVPPSRPARPPDRTARLHPDRSDRRDRADAHVRRAFRLSMDYEVYLLARIRERFVASGDSREATVEGLQRTGRILTASALLMLVVFPVVRHRLSDPPEDLGVGHHPGRARRRRPEAAGIVRRAAGSRGGDADRDVGADDQEPLSSSSTERVSSPAG